MYKVPSVGISKQFKLLEQDILNSISAIGREGNFILGKNLSKFEKLFSHYCQSKYALGLKVVDKNGQRITMTSSFLRTILYIIGAQAFLLCLGVVMIGFTEYKQGLHDILANTYVVTNYWEGPVPLEDNFGG